MEDTKERIREILDSLLNYQGKELDEKDITELSKIKKELKLIKQKTKKQLIQIKEEGINKSDISVGDLKSNLTRIELALEGISSIISESVIILGTNEGYVDYSNDEYDDINKNMEHEIIEEINSQNIDEKLEERKKVKDPLEAFFVSYDNANKLIRRIKTELKK